MGTHQAIRTEKEYKAALAEIERLLAYPEGSLEERELETVSILVEAYERERDEKIPDADPIQVLSFVMEQQGLTRVDLEPMIGPRGRVSEVMTYKRPLSLTMMRALSEKLHIPLGALATQYSTQPGEAPLATKRISDHFGLKNVRVAASMKMGGGGRHYAAAKAKKASSGVAVHAKKSSKGGEHRATKRK